jgi:hypothetical protein
MKPIEATLNAWSANLGIDSLTFERRLKKAGVTLPRKGELLSLQSVLPIISSDEQSEKKRLITAQAIAQERENKVEDENWFHREDVEKLVTELLLPLRQHLISAPTTLDARCNPSEPLLARAAITSWRDEVFKQIQINLPKKKGIE